MKSSERNRFAVDAGEPTRFERRAVGNGRAPAATWGLRESVIITREGDTMKRVGRYSVVHLHPCPEKQTVIRRSLFVLPIALTAAVLLAVGVSAPTLSYAGDHGYSFRAVAKLGDPAPGGGNHEGDFEPQDINASGTVFFASDLSTGGEGLFRSRHGVNSQIVRSGLPAPGTSTNFGIFGILTPGGSNDAGDFAFGFTLPGFDPVLGIGTNAGVWRYSQASGAVTKVLAPGDPAPGGTTFRGTIGHSDLNNRGEIATVGIIDTPFGNCADPGACLGLGRGVYKFDQHNNATTIAAPGDPAPAFSSTFDDAWDPNINNGGDVVFGGHVTGETCIGRPTLGCFESLYLYRASTGTLSSLVHQGDPAPDGGTFDFAFNGRLNNVGDVSFIGVQGGSTGVFLTGVFLYKHTGSIVIVAKPGDSLPGGIMANSTFNQGAHGINAAGDVAFVAQLDADADSDGVQDTGVYLYHAGKISTVVRTGTVIPGLGTVAHTNNPFFVGSPYPWPTVHLNSRGEVLTQVILTNGNTYVVVATPH